MKLKVLWMYHDIMDLYGDKGNIQVLTKRCEARNIGIEVDTCGIGEKKRIADYDLLFIGGGADREQGLLYQDLLSRKQEIVEAMDTGMFTLLICGGYQFLGEYYLDGKGNKITGLQLFDYYTDSDPSVGRCIGNIVVDATLDNEHFELVGFENHGGQTYHVETPLGKVVSGHGNTYNGGFEGFYNGCVLGTYIHGPLLPKNPKLADFIIKKALSKNYENITLSPLDDTLENKAHEVMVNRVTK